MNAIGGVITLSRSRREISPKTSSASAIVKNVTLFTEPPSDTPPLWHVSMDQRRTVLVAAARPGGHCLKAAFAYKNAGHAAEQPRDQAPRLALNLDLTAHDLVQRLGAVLDVQQHPIDRAARVQPAIGTSRHRDWTAVDRRQFGGVKQSRIGAIDEDNPRIGPALLRYIRIKICACTVLDPIEIVFRYIGFDALAGGIDGSYFESMQIRRKFRVVMFDPIETVVMPAILDTFASEAPNASIELLPVYGTDVLEELRDQTIDLAFYTHIVTAENVRSKLIAPSQPVCVARKGHPHVKGEMDRELFDRCGHVVMSAQQRAAIKVDEALLAQGATRRVVVEVNKLWSTVAIVSKSDLIAMLPRSFARQMAEPFGLQVLPCPYDLPPTPVFMLWHISNDNDPEQVWLRSIVSDAFEKFITTNTAMN
jgi:DNA-binding transcriptional LysR family regulator